MTPRLATLAFALLAPPAFAATPINETRPLDAQGQIEIENLSGRIEVRTWDRNEVRITGSLGDGVERLAIDGGGDRLSVRVRYPRNTPRNVEPTTLVLDVPRLASLDIDSVSADVDVNGSAGGRIDIDSVSGKVAVVGAPGRADVKSVSGDIRMNVNSDSVELESVSGNIALRGRIRDEIDVETVSGNFEVDSRGERPRRIESSSVSGDTDIRSGLADGGRISAESVSGNIRLVMPKDLSARVGGESFSGTLSAPGAQVNKAKYGPGSNFQHTYGQGSGEIRIETFSGNAKLVLE